MWITSEFRGEESKREAKIRRRMQDGLMHRLAIHPRVLLDETADAKNARRSSQFVAGPRTSLARNDNKRKRWRTEVHR